MKEKIDQIKSSSYSEGWRITERHSNSIFGNNIANTLRNGECDISETNRELVFTKTGDDITFNCVYISDQYLTNPDKHGGRKININSLIDIIIKDGYSFSLKSFKTAEATVTREDISDDVYIEQYFNKFVYGNYLITCIGHTQVLKESNNQSQLFHWPELYLDILNKFKI